MQQKKGWKVAWMLFVEVEPAMIVVAHINAGKGQQR